MLITRSFQVVCCRALLRPLVLPPISIGLSLSDDSCVIILLIRFYLYKSKTVTIYANCYMYISFSLKVSFKTCKTKFTVFPCEIRKLSSPPSLLLSWVSFSPITLCGKIFKKIPESRTFLEWWILNSCKGSSTNHVDSQGGGRGFKISKKISTFILVNYPR